MNILISVLNGRMKGREFPVAEGKTVKIGRGSGADFVIVDAMSSRLHCEVTNNSTAFILRDLGSSNGTFKDDQAIKQVNVYSGDRFKIGSTVFEIRGLEGPIDNYMTNAEPVVRVEKSGITKTRIVLNPKRLEQEDEKKTVLRRVGPKQEKNDYTLGEFESLVSEIEGLDDEEEEDLPPITVIASGREVRPSTGDDEFPPVEVVESGYAKDSENDLEDLPPIEVVSSGKALERAERGPGAPELAAVDSDDEPEFEDSDLPVVTVESPRVSEPKSANSDNEAALADPFATESAERPSISVPEPMDSLDPPVASEMSIHVKTTYPEYGQEIPDPKLDAEPMGSPDTVTEHDGLVMVEPGRTREATPDEFMSALDAIPKEEPELRKRPRPEAEKEEDIPELEEAPPSPIPMGFDPVPKHFQLRSSTPIPMLEEMPGLEEEEEEEEEEKPTPDRMTVEFRKSVESAEDGDEESSLAILEPVPGFDYEDDLLCIRCGNMMEQNDIDHGLAQKEGKGFVCPKCVRTEIDGQMSGLGFGNLEVVDVGTIDEELLEEMKKEGPDIAEMLDEALRSQKGKGDNA